jgi:hypothetical protein
MVELSATRSSCIAIWWVSLVSFAAITFLVASQRVPIIVVLYFVIDSVRKLLDIPSYVKVKLSLCFNWGPRHEGELGEWRYSSTHSLTSALDGGEWSASRPGRFIPRERAPGTRWIGGSYVECIIKVKVKFSLCLTKHHAMKTYWGSGGIAPLILDLGTRWRWEVNCMPRPLHPQGKSPWYPLDRRLRGSQNRSGRAGEEKNSQNPPGIEP